MSSSKQVAAAVIILDECGVFGRKKNRKRREMWAKNSSPFANDYSEDLRVFPTWQHPCKQYQRVSKLHTE
jgi:hypothetical protein